MNLFLFLKIQYLIMGLRILLAPLVGSLLPLLHPWFIKRSEFELRNLSDPHSKSFKESATLAPVLFEISSEGELEQVRPIMEFYLMRGDSIEVVFTSESVEKRVSGLAKEYEGRVAIFRLPLITYFPWIKGRDLNQWATAKNIIFCRYDFYPELLLFSKIRKGKAILISGTLKSKPKLSFYKRALYQIFDVIVAATAADAKRLQLEIPKEDVKSFDFRYLQIFKRVDRAREYLQSNPLFDSYLKYLEKFEYRHRLVLGSAWPVEMNIFKNQELLDELSYGKRHALILPHKLGESEVTSLVDEFKRATNQRLAIYVFKKSTTRDESERMFREMEKRPGVVIMALSGYLCELYSYFGFSFVGGGHGRSIHSVLEPFLSKSIVLCGPKIYRSTEFDLINEISRSHVKTIEDLTSTYDVIKELEKLPALDATIDEERRRSFKIFEILQNEFILWGKD